MWFSLNAEVKEAANKCLEFAKTPVEENDFNEYQELISLTDINNNTLYEISNENHFTRSSKIF